MQTSGSRAGLRIANEDHNDAYTPQCVERAGLGCLLPATRILHLVRGRGGESSGYRGSCHLLEEDGEIDNPITGGGILLDDDGLTTEGVVLAQETDDPIDPDLPASDPLTQEGAVIYFSYDSAHIDERAVPRILEVGEALLADPALRARLEGHTDERGTRSYNLSLGELRGQSVRAFLKQQGVEGNRIEVVSHGEEIPVVEGSDEEAWKQNRRVEILLSQ